MALGFIVIWGLLFLMAMQLGLNHDEQQFIASGKLWATHGLLPYRDYPYFHTPFLVLVYGLIFTFSDHLLLAARSASTLWAWLGLVVIFAASVSRLRSLSPGRRYLIALAPVLLLAVNPVFIYTYGKAWNQSLPALLIVLAIVCQCRGARTGRGWWFGGSGILVALAVSTRLSYAPLGLPFLVMAWFIPNAEPRARIRAVISWGVGLAVGFLPAAIIVLQAPAAFLFDNFIYNGQVTAAYRGRSGQFLPATGKKILFLLKLVIQPANLFFLVSFIFVNWPLRRALSYFQRLVLAVLAFSWLGALPATPSFTQYYFPIVTIGALGFAAGLAAIPVETWQFRYGVRLMALSIVISMSTTIYYYRDTLLFAAPTDWIPMRNHAEGVVLRAAATEPGPIVALAPLVPLEAGLDIYPSFANGPFAWRTADLLKWEHRARFGFVGDDELEAVLAAQPPGGIFTGREKELDPPLIDYAKAHGFRKVEVAGGKVLWLPPHR